MTTTQDYALLSLYVYNVEKLFNQPLLPDGWELAEAIHIDDFLGFSYGVFRRIGTTEIVVAYTGTNEGRDWWSNGLAGTGLLPSSQIAAAAKAYLDAKAAYGSNITLSGHSLGGGLASVMAVWFDRPAIVFDEGPFEATALNPLVMTAVAASLVVTGNAVPSEFLSYIAGYLVMYGPREAQVTNHYLQGEVLATLRAAWPTVLGNDNRIDINGVDASSTQLHSMSLLVAAKMSESFRLATYASSSVIPLMLSEHLYGLNTATSADRNFLIDLIRSEQTTPANGKLTHFSNDMFKLGASLEGLNQAAQNAIIAQGIEWYYWQSNNYGGQEFFTQSGNLLQYTTAQGAGLDGALNKANLYTSSWLATLNSAYGLAYMPIIKTDYEQWNVNGGVNAVTATAKNIDKTQIYIGQAGADSFTGGNKDDVFFAGGGADTLAGGLGNDSLYGGDGEDTYQFTGTFGNDIIIDSDGKGKIQFDQNKLSGGTRPGGSSAAYVSQDGQYSYVWTGGDLLINGVITVKDFKNKDLGIYLDVAEDPANPVNPANPANPATPPVHDPDRSRRLVRLDPLALDLNGDGKINTISSTLSQSYFDFNHDGIAERSGWIAPGDGLLTLDENGNNVVDGLDELFGSMQHGVCNMWTGLASCLFTQLSHPKSARIKQELAIF